MTDVKAITAADLVAHLHPADRPSRAHTFAAGQVGTMFNPRPGA